MLQKMRQFKGQTTLEYAILIIIIIAALLTLQTYIKRGLQGRWKQATDDIGDQFSTASSTNYLHRVVSVSNTTEVFSNGVTSSDLRADSTTNTTKHANLNAEGEYWARP